METHHRLAEERCLFGVLSQPVENGHAQGLFQPGSPGLDRLEQALPSARYPRTCQRQDRRPSCAKANWAVPSSMTSPRCASVRMKRLREGAWVFVAAASSSARFGPLARWSAKLSLAAT